MNEPLPPWSGLHYGVAIVALFALSPGAAPSATTAAQGGEGIVLQGRVVDCMGRPIAGAGCALVAPDSPLAEDALTRPLARSDATGRIVVRLPKRDAALERRERTHVLLFAAPGKAAVTLSDHDLLTGRVQGSSVELGNLILMDGMALHGRVRDKDGKPIEGALVTAIPIQWKMLVTPDGYGRFRPCSATRSGADGMFHLSCADRSALTVFVAKEGYYHRSVAPVGHETPLNVELARSGFVSGRLLDGDGQPLQTELYIFSRTAAVWTRSASDGSFRAGLPSPGGYSFRTQSEVPGRVLRSETFVGPRDDLVLRAFRPRKVAIVSAVDTDTKQPIAELEAGVQWGAVNQKNPVFAATYVRDCKQMRASHDGTVELWAWEPEQKTGAVVVTAGGYAPAVVGLPDAPDGDVPRIEVALAPGATLSGRVVDAVSGAGIAGARVWAMFVPPSNGLTYGTPPPGAVSGADGSFRLEGLVAGQQVVQAVHGERPVPNGVSSWVSRSQPAADVVVKIAPNGSLRGKLVGAPIDPLWYLEIDSDRQGVSIPPGTALWHSEFRRAEIAADGTFSVLRLSPGEHGVDLVRTGYGPARTDRWTLGRVAVGATDSVIELDVSVCRTGLIRGSFAAARGHAERVVVFAIPHMDPARDFLAQAAAGSRSITTFLEPDGTFVLAAPPGEYDIAAGDVATGRVLVEVEEPVRVTAAEPARCEIEAPLGIVTVRLPGRGTAKPLQDAPWELVVGVDHGGMFTNPRPIDLVAHSIMHGPRLALDPMQREVVVLAAPGPLPLRLGDSPGRTIEVVAGKQEVELAEK